MSNPLTPVCLVSSFLSQWLFRGWLDEKEEFGIHSNHRALQCRGEALVLINGRSNPPTLPP